MGSLKIICLITLWVLAEGSDEQTRDWLDSFVYHYSLKKLAPHPRTSRLYDVALPANFSGVRVSFLRLRASALWRRGANVNSTWVQVPPQTIARPFSTRVDLVYQDLGDLSWLYYRVPDHTMVAPVLGVLAYDANTDSEPVELILEGDENIVVQFPNTRGQGSGNKCVRFDTNGTLEFSNVSNQNRCTVRKLGHFCMVVRNKDEIKGDGHEKRKKVIGAVLGVVGLLVICGIVAAFARKKLKRKKVRKMETRSERSEGLGTTWVGDSRMPSASTIRTQPVIETNYAP